MTLFSLKMELSKSYEQIFIRIWFLSFWNWNWAPFICATFLWKLFESYFCEYVLHLPCSYYIIFFSYLFFLLSYVAHSSFGLEHLLHLLFIFHLILFASQTRTHFFSILHLLFFFISSVCLLTTVIVNLYLTFFLLLFVFICVSLLARLLACSLVRSHHCPLSGVHFSCCNPYASISVDTASCCSVCLHT